ncbi:MAG: flagellar basal body L-ring protein FlgH [Alphaproteobacteria bacterium]|nr:flagellar basal body L-ring protein FlgH [Alphaproteobacteria bacterium]
MGAGHAALRRSGARLGATLLLTTALAGCNLASRLANVGGAPDLTPVQNPTASPDYRPVTMPMPAVAPAVQQPNSLWRAGARAFFKDQRAGKVGDILTVVVNIQDSGAISNQTARSRAAGEDAAASAFLGYQASAHKFLPTAVDPGNLVNVESSSSNTGNGSVTRNETITMRVAAVVTQVLPNGNLAISGRQEVRINFEVRELEVAGVIRPEDVAANNTITSDKIAEARVSYGGRGQIMDVQQPRYIQQIFDIVFPF